MNDSPWEILNLDPELATEKEAKRSYSRLITVHRPDKDPARFAEIHQAFEIVRAHLRWKNNQTFDRTPIPLLDGASETSIPQSSSHEKSKELPTGVSLPNDYASPPLTEQAPTVPGDKPVRESSSDSSIDVLRARSIPADHRVPASVISAWDNLWRIWETSGMIDNGEEEIARLSSALDQFSFLCWDTQDCLDFHEKKITMLLRENPLRMSKIFHGEHLVRELEHDRNGLSLHVLRCFAGAGCLGWLINFESILTDRTSSLQSPEAAEVFLLLAFFIAFPFPLGALRLVNRAFPFLTPLERRQNVPLVEQAAYDGQLLQRIELTGFWTTRMRYRHDNFDWKSQLATNYIKLLVRHSLITPSVIQNLVYHLSEEGGQLVTTAFENRDQFLKEKAPVIPGAYSPPSPTSRPRFQPTLAKNDHHLFGCFLKMIGFIFLFAILHIIRNCSSPSNTPRTSYTPSQLSMLVIPNSKPTFTALPYSHRNPIFMMVLESSKSLPDSFVKQRALQNLHFTAIADFLGQSKDDATFLTRLNDPKTYCDTNEQQEFLVWAVDPVRTTKTKPHDPTSSSKAANGGTTLSPHQVDIIKSLPALEKARAWKRSFNP